MMLRQEPLPTHDGRPGNRGSIVNVASQLGIVGRPAARKLSLCRPSSSNVDAALTSPASCVCPCQP